MNPGDGGADEADPATVSGFRLDKYLVTVGRYRQFVNAVLPPDGGSGWLPAAGSGKHTHLNDGQGLASGPDAGTFEPGWVATDDSNIAPTNANLACDTMGHNTWTNTAGADETLPMVCPNWWEAYAFCIWDGGFLPSEAEWEYAAAGGSQEREYPWGSTDPGMMDEYAVFGCYYPSGLAHLSCFGGATIAPVGSAPLGAGLWGQLDLVGNAFEWDLDWSAPSFVDPCTNCATLAGGSLRVIAGGSFSYDDTYLAPSNPYLSAPTDRSANTGFRCARTP
jgi:formylglycine-generating enzyme required for sulfatase activity